MSNEHAGKQDWHPHAVWEAEPGAGKSRAEGYFTFSYMQEPTSISLSWLHVFGAMAKSKS